MRLFDHAGQELDLNIGSIDVESTNEPHAASDSPSPIRNRLMAKVRFWADDLPPLGYRAYRFHFVNRPTTRSGGLVTAPNVMENEFLHVAILADGSIAVSDKETDPVIAPTVYFEDGADCGDSYNFARPLSDRVLTTLGSPAQVALVEGSPAAAAFQIRHRLDLPERFDRECGVRSERTVPLEITTRVSLGVRSRYVAFRSHLRNTACDHRLRVVFRPCRALARESLSACAEAPFDVVEWPIAPPHADPTRWAENQPSTIPQGSFVDLSDGQWGIAVLNKGLPECEVVRDPEPRIYLTLFRSFSHLSRPDLTDRLRPAGPPLPTPGGQCLREMEFEYALYPHRGRWFEADVQALAHEFVSGVSTLCLMPGGSGDLPPEKDFLRLEGDPLVALSTIERSQDGNAVLVRLWNGTTQSREARVVFDRPVRSAHRVRLDETVEQTLKVVRRQEVPLKIGARKIVTVKAQYHSL